MTGVFIASRPLLLSGGDYWESPNDAKLPDRLTVLEVVTWAATREARMVLAVAGCAGFFQQWTVGTTHEGEDDHGARTAANAYLKPDVSAFFCKCRADECECCDKAAIEIGRASATGVLSWSGLDADHWERSRFNWMKMDSAHTVSAVALVNLFPPAPTDSPLADPPTMSPAERAAEYARLAASLDADGIPIGSVRARLIAQRWNGANGKAPKVNTITNLMANAGKRGRPKKTGEMKK